MILDCTLRDGGYYTSWDFSEEIVETYIESFNHLPVQYLEIGYRSKQLENYLGEFFYCPIYLMEHIKRLSNKKLCIILNEKDTPAKDVKELLTPCIGLIDMVRIAVDPDFFERALKLGEEVKKMGFELCFNVMYMSEWENKSDFMDMIPKVNGVVDFFYLVDSFGGVYPKDVERTIEMVRSKTDVKLGFHGHDNLQMALANTLVALDNNIDIVDATITGMGRGAGNLKMELLLTVLNSKGVIDELDYNWLSKVVDPFRELQSEYEWGTSLPYMVSGANSIPQKQVMEWVSKRYYSFNSIIRALSNRSKGKTDNIDLPDFKSENKFKKALIVGGGPNVSRHQKAIKEFLDREEEICVIHASSKNVTKFNDVDNFQVHALVGNEGYRLENVFQNINASNRMAILPPYPRKMGTYIPSGLKDNSYQLNSFDHMSANEESVTTLCIETALQMGCKEMFFIGYDGYEGDISHIELELFNENEEIFSILAQSEYSFSSLTPSKYKGISVNSVYSILK